MTTRRPATELDHYRGIVEAARLGGWMVAHFRPARTAHGWATPLQGDPGYVDFTFVHPVAREVWFVEVKSVGAGLTPDQKRWRDALVLAGASYTLLPVPQVPDFRQLLVDTGR